MEEIFERIEQLKWNIKTYQGWEFGLVRSWQNELRELRKVVKDGTIL